jgi:ferredoxin
MGDRPAPFLLYFRARSGILAGSAAGRPQDNGGTNTYMILTPGSGGRETHRSMEINQKHVLVCDCEGTMALEAKALAKACGAKDAAVNTQLCRAQLANFESAAKLGRPMLVACTQEAPLFLETLDDVANAPEVRFANIREKAGWSKDGARALPKIAALLAEAALDLKPTTSVTMESKGVLLVLGKDETAIEAAKQVAGRLDATVLLTGKASVLPPRLMDVPVFTGKVKGATGHLGAFQVTVADFAPATPSSKGRLAFAPAGPDGVSACDLILDLRGGPPLFPAPEKRDGYFNPDPGNPALVMKALLQLTDLVGTFEKPRYVAYEAAICAHARSGKIGCTRCLDSCPTGAITPEGDEVRYDPYVCAGCGTCASVCPTGAVTYQLPAGNGLFERLRTFLKAYRAAGGKEPVLLVHDANHGESVIDLAARLGDGLPAHVLPFAVNQPTQIGLDFLLTAAAYGAAAVAVLVNPARLAEADALKGELAIAEAVMEGLGYGAGRFFIIDDADPTAVTERLYGLAPERAAEPADFLPMGKKRGLLWLALDHLHARAPKPVDTIVLPAGAPFGTVEVRVDGCTVCLACVGACPTGALKDNPDKPQLSFQESACVQCGLCRVTCPEKVIALQPRLAFLAAAKTHQVVKEEEPFQCIRCGKPFGTKSSIERITAKLTGHPMFSGPKALERLMMCDTCRVVAMTEDEVHPFAGAPRPRMRTTDDYLREREEMRKAAREDMKKKGLLKDDEES